jgi:hypothetical protein
MLIPSTKQWQNVCAKIKRQRKALREMNKALESKQRQLELLIQQLIKINNQLQCEYNKRK